ncbi:DUF4422 domain-containing protein [Olsenella sp. Marseille-P4559]|uniref:DUF4422 domain-containing protein n=1 Tax=Olsenella sp. Marseille-P4559 TaxID=2364795 RepID=UPI0010319170|nr:DUF4422 domain-containing protein [Olsenella sp. Marseille-P4559]
MPRISVIIPAYNVDAYLERCLASVEGQSFKDWEAIVVDDCSPDQSGSIAERFASSDSRFRVIRHEENKGLHLARKTGVEAVRGEYSFFLDGDDSFAPDFLEGIARAAEQDPKADVFHVGITVIAENGVTDQGAQGFAGFVNRPSGVAEGDDVLLDIFDEKHGQLVDWRATQRLYRTELLRRAFAAMTSERLERAEDGYEVFVISDLAERSVGIEENRGYIYHYGEGITGVSPITSARFGAFCDQFLACVEAAGDYVHGHETAALFSSFVGMRHKMLELLSNDLLVRVPDDEKPGAALHLSRTFGPAACARELWRLVRDRAYSFVDAGALPSEDDQLHLLLPLAERVDSKIDVATSNQTDLLRARAMCEKAHIHLSQLHVADFSAQDIRILVTTHKDVDVPKSNILQPIQVGPGNRANRFIWALHDDEGDNISPRNPMYCELTTQYWAWKNTTSPYVGFCHYRRYFNFTDTAYEENPYGEVMDDFIDADAVRLYGLDDASIRRCIEGYDLVTTGFKRLADFPGDFSTPREHYAAAPSLHIEDLNRCVAIVHRLFPDYAPDFDAFLGGEKSCFCNMYIMRRELFSSYCEFLFPVLDEFVRETDMSTYSREAVRTPGHLAERLFNVWYLHAMRAGEGASWKTKQLQCVHFTNPEPAQTFTPVFLDRESVEASKVVPVVFASDDAYVPVLTVAIESMLRNASPERFYDVVVLTRDISGDHQAAMRAFLGRHENVRITFFDVWRMVEGFELDTNNEHISVETYYRFLVQDVLSAYNKVVYLDSDLVVEGDVAQLFDTDLGDNLVAATRDVDYLANLNLPDGKRMRYTRGVLKMKSPYDYFQAGVLVLNTRAMRELHTVQEWLEVSQRSDFIYNDQDILNTECEGRATYLDASWNVTNDIFHRTTALYPNAPAAAYDAYLASRSNPRVVHFAGAVKPWTHGWIDLSEHFWNYARETPFYEAIIAGLHRADVRQAESQVMDYINNECTRMGGHERAVGEDNPLRQIVDPLAPVGSTRREVLKSIGRGLRGRS